MSRASSQYSSMKKDRNFKLLFSVLMMMGISIYTGYMIYLEQPATVQSISGLFIQGIKIIRHLIPLFVGWLLARNAALDLVEILYNLPDRQSAHAYLFKRREPHNGGKPIVVKSKILEDQRSEHVALRVGGPGLIQISSGEAAITERDGYVHRVLEAGTYYLEMLEYIYVVLDLKPQERTIDDVLLYTREYIPMTAVITIRFRINPGKVGKDDDDNPYPVDKEAVQNIVYARNVKKDGTVSSWDAKVIHAARHNLREIIHRYSLHDIMFDENVYANIHSELTPLVQIQLKESGFTLLNIRVASIKPKESSVFDQSIELWKTNQEAALYRQKAKSEANHLFKTEVGKAEAELDMIRAIIEGVDQARREGAVIDVKSTVSLRLIQAMEGLIAQASKSQPISLQLMANLEGLTQVQLREQNRND